MRSLHGFGSRIHYAAVVVFAAVVGTSKTVTIAAGQEGIFQTRAVVLAGDPAPGTPPGVCLTDVYTPSLNDHEEIVLGAIVDGPGVTESNDRGYWVATPVGLALIAREGDQAPGVPNGVVFRNDAFSQHPCLSIAARATFRAYLAGPGIDPSNDEGIWSGTPGSVVLVARMGDPAPGTAAGVTYAQLWNPVANAVGELAFWGRLTGSGVTGANEEGVWIGTPGNLSILARSGDPAPGTSAQFHRFCCTGITFNSAGEVVLKALLQGAGVGVSNDHGHWAGPPGGLSLIAREGDAAPDTPPGVTFRDLAHSVPRINRTGEIAFDAGLTGPGVTSANDSGLWTNAPGTVTLIAREGDRAPGTPPNVLFGGMYNGGARPPLLNVKGEVAILAQLTGPGITSLNDEGIWLGPARALTLVARKGNQAPGTPFGVIFSSLSYPALNDRGQVAFSGSLTGPGITSLNDHGIWVTDLTGAVTLLIREGDTLEIAPSDIRTVTRVAFYMTLSGGDDGQPSGFNNFGQVAFEAEFDRGSSGIFLASAPDQIPTISEWGLVIMTLLLLTGLKIEFGRRRAGQV